MTFAQIERVVGRQLPASKHHRAWWSNNASNNVMTRAWLAAGFRTERVDVAGEKLVFRRDEPERESAQGERFRGGFFAHVRARLGGTVRVGPGADLTAPTGEVWDAESK